MPRKKPAPPTSRPRKASALVASGSRIDLKKPPPQRKTEHWQRDCWDGHDNVGEVMHGVDFLSNAMSKIRLFGAMVPEDDREAPAPDPSDAPKRAIAALKTDSAPYGAILRASGANMFVAGECYLVGDLSKDTWDVRSTDELEITEKEYLIRDYPGAPKVPYKNEDLTVIHMMFRHPRWSGLPISPLRGVLASITEIRRIEQVIRNAARSRSAGPGLLLMPEEATFPGMDTATDPDDPTADPFIEKLMEAMMTPIADEDDPSAVVPMLVRAPGDVLEKIRKVDLSIDINEELLKLERALTRLAQGLPLPPEVVLGKAGLSHWTAASVDEATVTAYIDPFTTPIIDVLTSQYYRPFLIADGMSEEEANRRMLWYDVSQLITRPNRSADADFGLDHMAISDAAWRRIKGFNDDDAPDADERLIRLLLQRASFDPVLSAILMERIGITPKGTTPTQTIAQPPTPKPAAAPPETDDGNTPDPRRPTKGVRSPNPSSVVIAFPTQSQTAPIGLRLATIDRELRIKANTAADAAVTRSLERANATVISKLNKKNQFSTIVKTCPKLEAASRVGKAALEIEGIYAVDLLSNHFETFIENFGKWCVKAQVQAAKALSITPPDSTQSITAAQTYLAEALVKSTADKLFNPTESTDPLDTTPSIIPPIIIRTALHIAGGGQQYTSGPLTGIATGPLLLQSSPLSIECYEWCNNQSMPLEPHNHLNGIRFESWSDPILENSAMFPAPAHFYPGDHDQCSCDVIPVLA